ncbi:specifically androgen-regulated gene protein [Lycodopsis pacificus]
MPKSDTWPGGVAMEPLSTVDSAGSCDSVISVNSGYSQDSMEHLSPEERACLMYFEETIEALEVQEDSGFSNDEPDSAFQAGTGVNVVPSLKSDASASGKDQTSEPGSRVFSIEDRAEHHALNQTSEPQSSTAPAANMKDPEASTNLIVPPKPPVTESAAELCVSKDEDGHLQIVPIASLCPDQSNEASEIDVDVIPPPSDFMDEPGLPPQTQNVRDLPPSARIYHDEPGATVDLEQLRQRAFSKKTSVTQDPPNQPPKLSLPALSPGLLISPPPEAAEPRSPPAVAPKPKKLPANIILKSHKAAVAVSDDNSEHSVPTSRLDPQRVHIEALRKLGLLPPGADSGPALSPSFSPKSRNSWAVPLSPISPRPPHTPPITPSYTCVNSPPPACVPLQSPAAAAPSATSTAAAVQPAEVLPAPTGFSDSVGPPLSDNEPAVEDASEATVNAQVSTAPHTPPVKHLTPHKVVGVKSATLERSGLGLSSYMAEAGPASQPRKNRARQASLGNQKDFASAGREGSPVGQATSKEPELRRSLPHNVFQHSTGDKLPRSQGISVVICPRAENGGGRREALKKLGLLRD